jgi:hypothetical protein
MKKVFFILSLLSLTFTCYSQSKKIIGSWILRDSVVAMQFFTNEDGTIAERSGLANENIWNKTPRTGTYTFNDKGKLVITWSDKSIENREVKFEDDFKAAKIKFTDKKDKLKKTYLFLRVMDEEIITQ